MSEMRILTVRQPWAWAIIHGGKDVENRVRNIAGSYRGPVAIHVGQKYDDEAFSRDSARPIDEAVEHIDGVPYMANWGRIIGVVDLVDVHSASVIGGCGYMRHDCPDHGTCRDHCSKWAFGPAPKGWYQHLVLKSPRPLATPIPYRGALGLRRLDPETIARVLALTGETK